MSHFVVVVVGNDVEKQLAPFHEFECTGCDDEYVQLIDKTEEVKEDFKKYNSEKKDFREFVKSWTGRKEIHEGETPDLTEIHKYGYTVLNSKDEVVVTYDRTNPDKKWDWYKIGGRWTGYFKLKQGATGQLGEASLLSKLDPDYTPPSTNEADQALKKDIDFDAMYKEAEEKAAIKYDLYQKTVADLPPILSWKDVLKKHGEEEATIQDARDEYHAQPAIQALRKVKELAWVEPDDFQCTKDEYIQRARNKAITPFAVLKDGKWYENGEMGWWGMVKDEKDQNEWSEQFTKLLESFPNDTLLTAVDCHI